MSLDKWFVKKDNDGIAVEAIHTVFFLDGDSMNAIWIKEIPKPNAYSTTIKWTDGKTVTLVLKEINKFSNFAFPPETIYNNVPYLKSHLQKCIRRSNLNLTLKTALHLAKLDLQELLRRLCIIMVEDAMLMPEFSTLVWLMSAVSKGYSLDKKKVYWLFGLIAKTCNMPYKESISSGTIDSSEDNGENNGSENRSVNLEIENRDKKVSLKQKTLNYKKDQQYNDQGDTVSISIDKKGKDKKDKKNVIDDWKKWKLYKLKEDDKSVVQSLLFRESYGGMPGDKNMLLKAASLWYNRFLNEITSSNSESDNNILKEYRKQDRIVYISPPSENLNLSEWILPAIDFHVVNNMIMILVDKYETLSYANIKDAIWHHSSKYTNKEIIGVNGVIDKEFNRTIDYWNLIRGEFYGLANYFLKNNH